VTANEKTVLVVDDEQCIAVALSRSLEANGYRVINAQSGEEALLQLKQSKVSLVILDIMMPGMDGLEALKYIKSYPDFRQTPIILMSGGRPLVKQQDYKWDVFLNKPFEINHLLTIVEELIGKAGEINEKNF
jgi:CheY-like chemotaxis protein